MTGSNRRPSACKADALPTELITQRTKCYLFSILSQVQGWLKKINGGTDGTRTRDPGVADRYSNWIKNQTSVQIVFFYQLLVLLHVLSDLS